MKPSACIISRPAVDFDSLIGIGHELLGHNPAAACDQTRRPLSTTERYLSCLASFHTSQATVSLLPHLLGHVSYGVLIAADERDLMDILEVCSGMQFVAGDTVLRGAMAAVVTGSVAQWRDAVVSGLDERQEVSVRACFGSIIDLFSAEGLTTVWRDYERRTSSNGLPLLTYRR